MVGHRIKNHQTLNSESICPCCSLLLRDPVQIIDCGHRLCRSCADEQKGSIITCPKCHEKSSKEEVKSDRGFKNELLTLSVVCFYCGWFGVLKNYPDHLNQKHPNPKCDYCEQSFLTVSELDEHQLYVCEKMLVYCPLKQLGCEEMVLRINLSEHYRSKQHQKALMSAVVHLQSANHAGKASQLIIDSPHTTRELEEIDQTMNILSDGVAILNEDQQRLTTEHTDQQRGLDAVTKDFSKLKVSMQEQDAFLMGMRTNQDMLVPDIESMQQNLNDMKSRSYDGTLLWRITDVKAKMGAARSDQRTSIYSPPFYTSLTGYKFCLRLYLDGDGNARGTHLSLFIVLMRGEYDLILKFPFEFKVIFCLFDQTKQQKHIIDAFRPDLRSNSFQRPRSDTNVASGLPQFADLTLFQAENNPYIHADIMYIKVMIDFGDVPKVMLPYVFSLNPGLSRPIHQGMIQMEHEKRQNQSSSIPLSNVRENELFTMNSQQTADSSDDLAISTIVNSHQMQH